jgi:transposase
MNKDKPHPIEITAQEMEALIERGEQRSFFEQDYPIVVAVLKNYFTLDHVAKENAHTILRLVKMVFGHPTEKAKEMLKNISPKESSPNPGTTAEGELPPKVKPKGHGRNGASAYEGAEKVHVPHSCYKAGDGCPLCPQGKLYRFYDPGVEIRIVGKAPLEATVYETEKLRCHLCGHIFTAQVPEEAGKDKYDETAGAMVPLLKYGAGLPFNRLEKLQESLGVPLPASTQWEITEKSADKIHPVHRELIREAAQGEIFYHDDTLMKILANLKAIETEDGTSRKGSFTTGILAVSGERRIALFFTGPKHAGENLTTLLKQRTSGLSPPIQMCDAASRNMSKEAETLLANCLSHGRRNFVDLVPSFPEPCRYVIEALAKVYHHDDMAKEQNLSKAQRLQFHQERSGPVMEKLNEWLKNQLDQRKVEPNSSMGKAIDYMLNHWEPLTLFLRVPGAPLDNNLCYAARGIAEGMPSA